jgi:hypothetical protein
MVSPATILLPSLTNWVDSCVLETGAVTTQMLTGVWWSRGCRLHAGLRNVLFIMADVTELQQVRCAALLFHFQSLQLLVCFVA